MEPTSNPLVEFVERIRARPDQPYDWQPVIEPPNFMERRLEPCPPPDLPPLPDDLDAARALIRSRIGAYLETHMPDTMLLIKTSPGTGKTTLAVEAIDQVIAAGRRVAYAGPRHDFYAEVAAKSAYPGQWYEWLPRQTEDPETGKIQTCQYTAQINEWLQRGYPAIDFCSGVCGWDYVNKQCIYYRQKSTPARAVYIQHQHVTLGHPLQFQVLIGDESPLQAFAHEWRVPVRWILPPGMPDDDPLKEVLFNLSLVAQNVEKSLEGPEIFRLLSHDNTIAGGAQAVLDACENFTVPAGALAYQDIHRAEQASEAPYFHLPALVSLLDREARQALAERPYPHRIILTASHMTLLLRRTPNPGALPPHVIWLDATGRPELYEHIFQRKVEVLDAAPRLQGRIYQVVDRANGKQAITGKTGAERTDKAAQAETVINRIIADHDYRSPVVISYKNFVENMQVQAGRGHFYAARGTNAHEDADAVIVMGAPQANIYQIVKLAKMLYFERDTAFQVEWMTREQVYPYVDADGQGRCYPVSGFWRDAALQLVLETVREDEILQAAHRGRPVNHPVDIWLLTNLPIPALRPNQLLTMREILKAPAGVNMWKWEQVQSLMESQDVITTADIEALGISRKTAGEYLEQIIQQPGWELAAARSGLRGKPAKMAKRNIA